MFDKGGTEYPVDAVISRRQERELENIWIFTTKIDYQTPDEAYYKGANNKRYEAKDMLPEAG